MMNDKGKLGLERWHFIKQPFTRELSIQNSAEFDHLRDAKRRLLQAITEKQSAALVGPAGCGKTVLLRNIIRELPEAQFKYIYIKLSELGLRDTCRKIAVGLGLEPKGSLPSLMKAVEESLSEGYFNRSQRQLLILDDVHELRCSAFKLMRMFTNFEMDSKLVVSFLLVGQNRLKNTLLTPDLEDVHQRLVTCAELRVLSKEETVDYITHRVREAGCSSEVFSPDAIEALYEIARGNMRALDRLARSALHVAAGANRNLVEVQDVTKARSEVWS